ncbi:MAG: ParB/RepB/Spo0J family partition protein [Arenimonas sp.]|uniref:ParB/RepB/Spo0J family partition protein n=1 Tax=Arenimonas sp. TaxID=1872635 RepID=UPI0025C70751|nr:ParB/RepB/Spo0J family partition protein [Arenimonas sp.]MBW8367055.1 ParB/RepB/Spo0J family partition protein [Arenimonas sp.]
MSTKKRGLGRGLEALLGTGNKGAAPAAETDDAGEGMRSLPITALQPGKYQPRTGMDPAKLTELAESIKAQGLIQPIVVRQIGAGKDGQPRYEIIAGERRWRAATQAGLTDIPVVLREVDDRAVIAMALIENIQREDLNPLEEAQALSRLIDEFSLTHQQAAEAVGRSRAAVSNLLRLLELPDGIRKLLEEKALEMGHARALLTLAPAAALQLAREAVAEGWSVREVERRAQMLGKGQIPGKAAKANGKKVDPDIAALERELSETLSAKVAVQHGRGGRGKLVISYHGLDTLDGILERLRGGG